MTHPEISDGDYDALRRRNEAIETRFPKTDVGPTAPRAERWARRRPSGFAKVRSHGAYAVALGNAFDDDGSGRVLRPHPMRFLGLAEDAAGGGRRRAQDRRSVLIALRYEAGPLCPGGDPRRRLGLARTSPPTCKHASRTCP